MKDVLKNSSIHKVKLPIFNKFSELDTSTLQQVGTEKKLQIIHKGIEKKNKVFTVVVFSKLLPAHEQYHVGRLTNNF